MCWPWISALSAQRTGKFNFLLLCGMGWWPDFRLEQRKHERYFCIRNMQHISRDELARKPEHFLLLAADTRDVCVSGCKYFNYFFFFFSTYQCSQVIFGFQHFQEEEFNVFSFSLCLDGRIQTKAPSSLQPSVISKYLCFSRSSTMRRPSSCQHIRMLWVPKPVYSVKTHLRESISWYIHPKKGPYSWRELDS